MNWIKKLFSKKKETETKKKRVIYQRDIGDYKRYDDTPITRQSESPISIMSDGHIGVNIGNGLSMDMTDGSIGVNVGGGFSFNGFDDNSSHNSHSHDHSNSYDNSSNYDSGSSYSSDSSSYDSGSSSSDSTSYDSGSSYDSSSW